jgi:isopentenyl-diphosphate delta-isomerase
MNNEFVQLVDEEDHETGIMEKLEAHKKGLLHRAVSVFVFNSKGELLLQQRAPAKYHSATLWSNTCCTHPRPGETTIDAAKRRLLEEMGIKCSLTYCFNILYKAALGNGYTEHEFDHVFTATCDELPVPDPNEVASWTYVSLDETDSMLQRSPDIFTAWFPLLYNKIKVLI